MEKISIGITLLPRRLEAVVVSMQNFSILNTVSISLTQPLFKHDLSGLTAPDYFKHQLEALMLSLGYPDFYQNIYLNLSPLAVGHERPGSSAFENTVVKQSTLCAHEVHRQQEIYSELPQSLILELMTLFYEVGYKLSAIELTPLCGVRALAASGVLDKLIQTIGSQAYWGCVHGSDEHAWWMIWQGNTLIEFQQFPAEISPQQITTLAQEKSKRYGIAHWLTWQEASEKPLIALTSQTLGAPASPMKLSPLYGSHHEPPIIAALGSALKSEFTFPLNWNFMDTPDIIPIQEQFEKVPYVNYRPVLPALCMKLSTLGLIGSVTVFSLLYGFNHYFGH